MRVIRPATHPTVLHINVWFECSACRGRQVQLRHVTCEQARTAIDVHNRQHQEA